VIFWFFFDIVINFSLAKWVFSSNSEVSITFSTRIINIHFKLKQTSKTDVFFLVSDPSDFQLFVFLSFEKCVISMDTDILSVDHPLIKLLSNVGNCSVSCNDLVIDSVVCNACMFNFASTESTISFVHLIMKNVRRTGTVCVCDSVNLFYVFSFMKGDMIYMNPLKGLTPEFESCTFENVFLYLIITLFNLILLFSDNSGEWNNIYWCQS
jgi:hypothetical protein